MVGVPADPALADPGFAEAFRRVVGRVDARPVPVEPLFEAGDLLYDGPWVAERLAGLADVPRRRTPTTSCRSPAR